MLKDAHIYRRIVVPITLLLYCYLLLCQRPSQLLVIAINLTGLGRSKKEV